MNSDTLYYLGGLFDGEGCLTIKRLGTLKHARKSPVYIPELRIRMCHPKGLDLFVETFGCNITFAERANPKHSSIYTAYSANRKAQDIAKKLLPFLRVKREECLIFLDYFTTCLDPYDHWRKGNNRRPLPDELLALRHAYYLALQSLKSRNGFVHTQESLTQFHALTERLALKSLPMEDYQTKLF